MSNTTSIAAIAATGALVLAGCATSTVPASSESAGPLASAAAAPSTSMGCNAAELQQVLQRINEARQAGMCGDARLAPARPLAWQPSLAAAASRRAGEIAQRGSFGKVADVNPRLRQQGYQATSSQESQAAGDYSSNGAALALLAQQKQCTALLNPAYTDLGAACVTRPGSEFRNYWTVVVAQGTQTQAAMGAGPARKTGATKKNAATRHHKGAAPKTAPAKKAKAVKASDSRHPALGRSKGGADKTSPSRKRGSRASAHSTKDPAAQL